MQWLHSAEVWSVSHWVQALSSLGRGDWRWWWWWDCSPVGLWVTADNDSFQSSRSPRQLAATTTTTEQLRNTQSPPNSLNLQFFAGPGLEGAGALIQFCQTDRREWDCLMKIPGITVIVCQARAMSSPLYLTTNTGGQHGPNFSQSANILSVNTQILYWRQPGLLEIFSKFNCNFKKNS